MFQDEYKAEGIQWSHVDFVDNSNCLNLIVGRPVGLINLLDEECRYKGIMKDDFDPWTNNIFHFSTVKWLNGGGK